MFIPRSPTLLNLFGKHHILTDGLKRVYVVDIHDRRLDMTSSTPISLHFLVEKKQQGAVLVHPNFETIVIETASWSQMTVNVVNELLNHTEGSFDWLYEFKPEWSSSIIFSKTRRLVNMQKVRDNLYVNVGHVASQSLWLIEEILEAFGVAIGSFLIHRPPFSEAKEVTDEITKYQREDFKQYLVSYRDKSEEQAEKVVHGIDVINERVVAKLGSSYNNLYQFDNVQMLYNIKSKLLSNYHRFINWNNEQVNVVKKYIQYLADYYKKLESEAKKNPIDFYLPIM